MYIHQLSTAKDAYDNARFGGGWRGAKRLERNVARQKGYLKFWIAVVYHKVATTTRNIYTNAYKQEGYGEVPRCDGWKNLENMINRIIHQDRACGRAQNIHYYISTRIRRQSGNDTKNILSRNKLKQQNNTVISERHYSLIKS